MSANTLLRLAWRLAAALLLLLVSACAGNQPVSDPQSDPLASPTQPEGLPSVTAEFETIVSPPPAPTSTSVPTAAPTPLPSPTVVAWPTLAVEDGLVRQGEPLPAAVGPINSRNFDAVVTLARWGKGTLEAAGFSPDGRLLGVRTNLGRYLYDVKTGQELPPDESILRAIFPLDLAHYAVQPIASCCEPAITGLELLKDGERLAELDAHPPYAFSPDGASLATAAEDESYHDLVKVWNTADGSLKVALSLQGEDLSGQEIRCQEINALTFAPDLQSLAVACCENNLIYSLLLDGSPPRLLLDTQIGSGMVLRSLLFSPAGDQLAGGSEGGEGRLWDLAAGQILPPPPETGELFSPIAFSPDGAHLAILTGSGVLLWDLKGGANTFVHQHSGAISQFVISPDGKQVFYDPDLEIAVSSLADGSLVSLLPDLTPHSYDMAVSPDGSYLALQIVDVAPSNDAYVGIRALPGGARVESLRASITYFGPHLDFLPDGRLGLLVGEQVQLFSPGSWSQVGAITSPSGILAFDFSPGGETVALLTGRGIELRRVQTGRVEQRLKNLPEIQVWRLGYSPDGSLLVIEGVDASIDEAVMLFYDLKREELAYRLDGDYSDWAFSPDGELLVTTLRAEIQFRRAADGSRLGDLPAYSSGVYQVGFTPDGHYLLSSGTDGSLRVWGVPK